MSKKTGLIISTIAVAIAAITCLIVVIYGEDLYSALGMLLCTLVIYFSSLSAYRKDKSGSEQEKK